MFILDTNIVSNFRKKRPHPRLVRWVERVGWDEISMTAFTVMEIQVGIERARVTDEAVAADISAWLDGLIEFGQPQVIGFDVHAARLFARMYETPALRNLVLPASGSKRAKTGADLAIAAIAIVHGASVATNDVDDFRSIHEHFPLPGLFDPFADAWHPVR